MNAAANLLKRVCAAAAVIVVTASADAHAQIYVGSSAPKRGAVEISGGALWAAGQNLDTGDASLTPNPGAGLGSVELFASDATLKPAIGVQAAVGVYVTPRIMIEGGIRVARPKLEVELTNDFEGAPDVTATSTLTQYVFSGSLLYHFGDGRGSTTPYVAAGAGHVRDVHESNELVETGTEYHGSAGVKMAMGRTRRVSLRAEGGIAVFDGGFSVDEGRRIVPLAAVLLAYRF